jgi:hypothetical protein
MDLCADADGGLKLDVIAKPPRLSRARSVEHVVDS